MSRLLIAIVAAAVVGGGWVGPARAQDQAAPADVAPVGTAEAALANPGQGGANAPQTGADAGAGAGAGAGDRQATPAAAGAAGGDSMRAQCEAELRSNHTWRAELRGQLVRSILEEAPEPGDAQWRAELKRELASEVHTEDAQAMLTNKRHVVMAYAALWLLVLVFAVFLWMRQRGLKTEIARLERDIAQATAND